jgi:hypothetical protein
LSTLATAFPGRFHYRFTRASIRNPRIDRMPTIGLQKQSFSGEVAAHFNEPGEQP